MFLLGNGGCGGSVLDGWFALEKFFHTLKTHLTGLKGVERESQQRRGEDQLLDVNDQSNQSADAERSCFELAATNGEE